MAARKEKPVLSEQPSGPITRSQAATKCSRFGVAVAPSVSAPVKTGLKLTAKGVVKRGASDENTSTNAVTSVLPQPKRRTVLKDVTNMSCANSSKDCCVLTKMQGLRPSKKIERSPRRNEQCAKKIPKPLSPAGGGSSFVNDSCSTEETPKAGDSAGLDIVDIDQDNGNPQLCVSYVAEIYTNLMASELIRRPRSNYMEAVQQDITEGMRRILIDWLVAVSEEFQLLPDTLDLTVNLIDRFLSRKSMLRQKLQLLGITSMLIASKYEEIHAPSVEEFCNMTDNTYTKAEVLVMECQVLNDLGFHLSVPTPQPFVRRYLRAARATCNARFTTLVYLAYYLVELTLMDYGFLKFLPSMVAASAVFLARWTLHLSDHPWNSTLEHYTSYRSSDLRICVRALRELHHKISSGNLKAVYEKYTRPRYECVANLKSPELLESLFS